MYPVFYYSKAVCGHFIKNSKGKIINIGSISGLRGREGSVAYSTAKAGVEGFTKTIAKELGAYNVNCNVVASGYIDTDGQNGLCAASRENHDGSLWKTHVVAYCEKSEEV